ncbi:hypothetical protein [Myxosarcina sp. GI1]|uniref:hypothetical protein n=1 Tax=Myxosarcina sp. GI1 TaxID=1541065 RepID=UPI0012E08CBA|nr:hypothetical protein [Myxosarcina sp. GI1]
MKDFWYGNHITVSCQTVCQQRNRSTQLINIGIKQEDKEYPEELYPVVELSDSILELTEKLELIRGKLNNFEQRYLEADEEIRECEGYEIPSSTKLDHWQAAIEEMSNRIEFLGDPL